MAGIYTYPCGYRVKLEMEAVALVSGRWLAWWAGGCSRASVFDKLAILLLSAVDF